MTTEPKFVPKEAARIDLGEDTAVKVRLVDCVGFMTEGASGHMENEKERLVKTPWFEESIPFTMAAEIGTRKVIRDHSTIGLVITTDGSFGELERQALSLIHILLTQGETSEVLNDKRVVTAYLGE